MVDWGDNTQTDWIGPYPSDEIIPLTHSWTDKDTYSIRAKTKDIYNAESDWTTLEIQIPYFHNQYYQNYNLFFRIITWIQTLLHPVPVSF
jgi:hypothetical protein